jgi:hypothetical protein
MREIALTDWYRTIAGDETDQQDDSIVHWGE